MQLRFVSEGVASDRSSWLPFKLRLLGLLLLLGGREILGRRKGFLRFRTVVPDKFLVLASQRGSFRISIHSHVMVEIFLIRLGPLLLGRMKGCRLTLVELLMERPK
jgi:hypothetical protein